MHRMPMTIPLFSRTLTLMLCLSIAPFIKANANSTVDADAPKGPVAPLFELTHNDQVVSLLEHRGRVVYIDFWASWCSPCRKSFPWMNDVLAKHENKGLSIVAINLDQNPDDAKAFLDDTRPNFVIAYDPSGSTAEDYRVMGMPSSYIIGRDGTLVWKHIGFRKKDKASIEKHLVSALEQ